MEGELQGETWDGLIFSLAECGVIFWSIVVVFVFSMRLSESWPID